MPDVRFLIGAFAGLILSLLGNVIASRLDKHISIGIRALVGIMLFVFSIVVVTALPQSDTSADSDVSAKVSFYYSEYDLFGRMCKSDIGPYQWTTTHILALDLTNLSARSISLTKFQYDQIVDITPQIKYSIFYDLFADSAELNAWLLDYTPAHGVPLVGMERLFTGTVEGRGLPLTISAGETKRIFLKAQDTVTADKELEENQLIAQVKKAQWQHQISLEFGNGFRLPLLIKLVPPGEVMAAEDAFKDGKLDPRCRFKLNRR